MRPKKNPVTKLIGAGVKAAAKAAGKNVKPSLKAAQKAKPLATPKSGIKVKTAAKQIGNPPNLTKSTEEMYSSASRGGVGKGPLGKSKTARKFNTNAARGKMDVRKPDRMPDEPARATVKINSAKTTRVVKVSPKRK
jgi:hypothetical protein